MSTKKEILTLEDKRYAAMTSGDLASLEELLHDQLLYTHSSGMMDTKASWLLAMKSGKTRYKSVKCSGQQVRDAWAKTPQGWKFVAWQSTPQPA